jgi:glutathione-specific gamma-glutamylcyclotransferase
MLKREEITEERVDRLVREARRFGHFDALTHEEREENRRQFLDQATSGEDLWIFGYGSLVWNTAFHFKEKKKARLFGYHRRFSLHLTIGRGSPEYPGLMLALDRGGSCNGVAFRIESKKVDSETRILWMREMISGAYVPKWVSLQTDQGTVSGFTFVVNRNHVRYRGSLGVDDTVSGLINGKGPLGTCKDYLLNTVKDLKNLGIKDAYLERLKELALNREK